MNQTEFDNLKVGDKVISLKGWGVTGGYGKWLNFATTLIKKVASVWQVDSPYGGTGGFAEDEMLQFFDVDINAGAPSAADIKPEDIKPDLEMIYVGPSPKWKGGIWRILRKDTHTDIWSVIKYDTGVTFAFTAQEIPTIFVKNLSTKYVLGGRINLAAINPPINEELAFFSKPQDGCCACGILKTSKLCKYHPS